MPLVRIDAPAGNPPEHYRAIGDAVYAAMTETLGVPVDDHFQVITEHARGHLINAPNYLGIEKSAAAIIIQISLNAGRTVAMKQAFYRSLADRLHERPGLRREDVFISLVEVVKENWSFGNGLAQYA